MTTIIETPRLVLREWTIKDAEFIFKMNEDPDVTKYTGDGSFGSIENARIFVQEYNQYKRFGHGRWLCISKETGKPIGWCGLKNQMEDEGFIDLGYRLLKSEWEKGYASEAAVACLKFGFEKLGMEEIVGRAVAENVASIAILEKLGMTYYKTGDCHGDQARHYRIRREDFLEL